ncbi:TRAP transporter small permease [Salinarimonas sp.]|uniref:TRAP transporter small permease n=1 Tax=Salinarimonas sp. TaxID=2766526 RepID=UPI00391D9F5B
MLAALRFVDKAVFNVAMALAMALLATMACVSFYQVITRFVFAQPSTWSEVTSRSLQIWMVYLGLVAAFRTGALLAVDFLRRLAPPTIRVILVVAIAGLNLGVLFVMVWWGWEMAHRVRFQSLAGVSNPFTGENISISLVYAAIPIGAALSMVAVLGRLAEDVAEARAGGPSDTDAADAVRPREI